MPIRMKQPSTGRLPASAVFALFVCSGATGLVYEVVWLRQLILVFGSTLHATSAILATFMGGLAAGAFLGGRWQDRSPWRPLALYGVLELGIGAYAVAVPALLRGLTPLYSWVWAAGGEESFLWLSLAKFVGIAAVLLPPTALMGASLPVLARQVADDPLRIGGKVGGLYAVNTFGAVAGVFVAGFVAIPAVGVRHTVWATAAANLVLGAAALLLARRGAAPLARAGAAPATRMSSPRAVRVALLAFGASGFCAMVLEVAWTRGLSLVMGSSVYAFSLMLLAFLIGLAAGGAAFSALLRRRPVTDPARLLALLLASAGLFAYTTTWLLQALPRLFAEAYLRWRPSPNELFGIELLLGLLVMFPATFSLGGVFPCVLQLHARGLDRVARSVGTVYASNTLGTIAGAFAGGFLLVPRFGLCDSVMGVAAAEIALGAAVAAVSLRGRARVLLAAPMALAVLALPLLRPGWDALLMNSGVYYYIGDMPEGSDWGDFRSQIGRGREVVYLREGLTATIAVIDQPRKRNRYLTVNGKVEASTTGDIQTQLMLAHLPLLLHAGPSRDVMVVGLASGITAGAAAAHPIATLRIVEIEPAIVEAARLFSDKNNHVLDDPRLMLSLNDARNDLEFSPRQFDVIVSEPSNPFMTVAANLFTEDFFRTAARRIRPGGIFSQWLQAYCLPSQDLRSVIAAFREAFPHTMVALAGRVDLVLLGSDEPIRMNLERIAMKMSEPGVRADLARARIRGPADILPLFVAGKEEVDRLVQGAPRNTDDNARVEFSAPKAIALHTSEENLAMLKDLGSDPLNYLEPPPETTEDHDRVLLALAAAWARRDEIEQAARLLRSALGGPLRAEAETLLAALERKGRP